MYTPTTEHNSFSNTMIKEKHVLAEILVFYIILESKVILKMKFDPVLGPQNVDGERVL